jgi:quinoprotein relay system zinc metallohydrolase 2
VITRRRLLGGAAAAGCCCAALAPRPAPAAVPARLPVTEVAPGVFVHTGVHADLAADNAGDVANLAFVVGADAVAVVDTGGSLAVGLALRQAVRQVTPRPIRYVVATHAHPDHAFGHAAFGGPAVPPDDRATIVGHARLPAAIAARAAFYRANLERALGPAAAGSEMLAPDRTVEGTATLDLGGRSLVLTAHPTAHTDHDLTALDTGTGTLFTGDLCFLEHAPVLDGSLKGFLAVIDRLAETPARRAVPGHGPASAPWPSALAPERRYLATLLNDVRAIVARGGTIEMAMAEAGGSERDRWRLFDLFHRRNAATAFAELEWE